MTAGTFVAHFCHLSSVICHLPSAPLVRFREQSRLTALHRAQSFLADHATVLGAVSQSPSRKALDAVVTELERRAAAQGAARAQAASLTQHKRELRDELRKYHMRPIAVIARSRLAHTPLIAKLRVPVNMVSDSALIAAGNAMADVAGQYHAALIREQLPANFIAQLRAAVAAVRQVAVRRDQFQLQGTQATQGVADALWRASNVMKVLDALVVKQLKGKADLLAGWRRAKRVRAKPGVKRGARRKA
jgi:hypothetical protein